MLKGLQLTSQKEVHLICRIGYEKPGLVKRQDRFCIFSPAKAVIMTLCQKPMGPSTVQIMPDFTSPHKGELCSSVLIQA